MTKETKTDYDKEHDIFSMNWGGKVEHSVEMFDGELILDVNDKDEIVGFEIFGYEEQIEKHNKKMREIFK